MEVLGHWSDTFIGVLSQTAERLSQYLPNVFGAVLLLFAGWIVAHALRAIAIRLIVLGERAIPRMSTAGNASSTHFPGASTKILGNVIFWGVVLFFLTAATQVLGLDTFTTWLMGVVDYLPTVFAGVLIIAAGFLFSRIAREVVTAAAINTGDRQRALIGRVVQAGILVTAILVGAEQIGIKVTFLVVLASALGISLAGAVALSLSLGAREYVANLIGGHYLRQRYSIGQQVCIAGHEGRILELTETAIILETLEGRLSLPAKVYNEQPILMLVNGDRDG